MTNVPREIIQIIWYTGHPLPGFIRNLETNTHTQHTYMHTEQKQMFLAAPFVVVFLFSRHTRQLVHHPSIKQYIEIMHNILGQEIAYNWQCKKDNQRGRQKIPVLFYVPDDKSWQQVPRIPKVRSMFFINVSLLLS